MLWASWLRRPKHSRSTLLSFPLSQDLPGGGTEEGPPLLCLCWAVSFLRSSSTFLHLVSCLSSSSLLPPGCLADSLLYFSCLCFLLFFPTAPSSCLSVSLPFCSWFSPLSSLTEELTGRRGGPHSCVPAWERGDFWTFFSSCFLS